MLGLAKSLPPAEMRVLLLTNIAVGDKELEELANQRAENVRQALSAKIAPDRLFIAAAKLDATGIADKGSTTRVDFSLRH